MKASRVNEHDNTYCGVHDARAVRANRIRNVADVDCIQKLILRRLLDEYLLNTINVNHIRYGAW